MVPADKYSYKPTPTVRTFGELLGHIADGNNYFCGRTTGKKVQWSDANAQGTTRGQGDGHAEAERGARCVQRRP